MTTTVAATAATGMTTTVGVALAAGMATATVTAAINIA
jgi:hypothetical protein